jgi:hypothetical protein
MQQSTPRRSLTAPAVFGIVLVAVGAAALAIQQVDSNFLPHLGAWGWPFFVIVPGLVLLGAAVIAPRPRGVGFAVGGAVVTTVGGILLYQSESGHWESWSYVWALLPTAAGAALLGYGMFAGDARMRAVGAWLAGVAGVVFVAAAGVFEGLFAGEDRFVPAGNWWPVALIGLGAAFVLWAVLRPNAPRDPQTSQPRPLLAGVRGLGAGANDSAAGPSSTGPLRSPRDRRRPPSRRATPPSPARPRRCSR